jgi:glutamate racemase
MPSGQVDLRSRDPIGFLDSAVAGLCVAAEVRRALPCERLVFAGDNQRLPWGVHPKPVITRYTRELITFLCEQRAKLVVFACNTASASALPEIQREFSVPLLGLIEPAALESLRVSTSRRIGVIGTQATVSSGQYKRAIMALDAQAQVWEHVVSELPLLVEAGELSGDRVDRLAREAVAPLIEVQVDTLILGCTAYVYHEHALRAAAPHLHIVDPAKAVVGAVAEILVSKELQCPEGSEGGLSVYTSGDPDHFRRVARLLLGKDILVSHQVFGAP